LYGSYWEREKNLPAQISEARAAQKIARESTHLGGKEKEDRSDRTRRGVGKSDGRMENKGHRSNVSPETREGRGAIGIKNKK